MNDYSPRKKLMFINPSKLHSKRIAMIKHSTISYFIFTSSFLISQRAFSDTMKGKVAAPDFLTKTYELVNNQSSDHIVSWSPSGTSFVIWRKVEFIERILPLFFNHSNFSSFNRQLNKYGFSKINNCRWEFANSNFVRAQPQLLKNIVRCPIAHNPPVAELTHLREEVERLRREKKTLEFKLEELEKEKQSYEEEFQRLKMNPEDIESKEEIQRKRKCLGKDDLSGKKSNLFEDIIRGKAKLPEIDLNSLPESGVVEDPMDSLSWGFKDASP